MIKKQIFRIPSTRNITRLATFLQYQKFDYDVPTYTIHSWRLCRRRRRHSEHTRRLPHKDQTISIRRNTRSFVWNWKLWRFSLLMVFYLQNEANCFIQIQTHLLPRPRGICMNILWRTIVFPYQIFQVTEHMCFDHKFCTAELPHICTQQQSKQLHSEHWHYTRVDWN